MSGPVIVLLTNTGPEGDQLARRLTDEGLLPALVVKEQYRFAPRYRLHSRIVRALFGDALVNRMAHARLPSETRLAIEWEHEKNIDARSFFAQAARQRALGAKEFTGEVLQTASVNSAEVLAHVQALRPDLMLVLGTTILRAPLLRIPRLGTINIHSSILPWYRGTFSEFWQCLNDDRQHVGVSFHLVTEGIDTGDIVHQHRTACEWPVDPFRLRALNMLAAIEHAPAVVRSWLRGETEAKPQIAEEGSFHFNRDRTLEKRVALWRRLTQG